MATPPAEAQIDELEWIATALAPDGVEMRLLRRGDEFTIALYGDELMSTRASASEEALAVMASARLNGRVAPQMLIGGYGMGYTLRAALGALRADASVTVAELVPEVIDWARGPMRALTAGCLDDPRVMLIEDDVAKLIEASCGGYDAILLDVDNGPSGLICDTNDYLYDTRGLQAAMKALAPQGLLAVWSAWPDPAFAARLAKTGFAVEEVSVRELADDEGAHHVIWFARKP